MNKKNKQKIVNKGVDKSPAKGKLFSIFVLVFSLLVVSITTYILYTYTQQLLHSRLRERLVAVASTASVYFTPEEIEGLRKISLNIGDDTIYTDYYKDINLKLNEIRDKNEDIEYIYILGRTSDIETTLFLADADVTEELILEEGDEGNDFPGSDYDVSDIPAIQSSFYEALADSEPISDEWGTFLSAYAPIRTGDGMADAILGIDVEVSDYLRIVSATLLPFTLFIVFLALMLMALTYSLVRMWGSRVNLLRELDRQKDELLGMVSHQLANPISAVKWNIEMMIDGDIGKLSDEQEKHLKSVYPQTQDLSDLASMILDVSRIQLGRMKVDRIEIDMVELINEVCEAVEPKAKDKKIKFIKTLPEKMSKAMLDRRLTRMTLDNLLNNAVRYTEKGEVEIKVELKAGMIHYEVRDTGCGIPKKDQEKIFGKLFRASNVRDTEGNGFGLYVAKGAVESQGGRIWFESTVNKGTTFYVDLPIIKVGKKDKKKVNIDY